MRKLLLLLLFSVNLFGSLYVPEELTGSSLILKNKKFSVVMDGERKKIKEYNLDPVIRKMTKDQRMKFITKGSLALSKLSDGEYTLKVNNKLNGGGIWGGWAGAFIGKFLVHAAAQTAYAVAAGATFLVCPPAAPVVYGALQATCAGPVEIASNVVAMGTGIAGAVATGPV